MNRLLTTIFETGLVPVIKIDDASKASLLGKALLAGGLPVAEVTFRTDAAEESIRRMNAECPGLLVGAGTVTSPELARSAIAAGARFIVSPGFNPATVDYCLEHEVPVVPGVNSPSMVEAGMGKGLEVLKFFPAEASGGLRMLDAMAGPFGKMRFIPTGGIDASNLGSYVSHPSVLAVGGSWMVKSDLIEAGRWDDIASLCAQASLAVHGFALAHVGINQSDAQAATDLAATLEILGFQPREGNSSIFSGTDFEIMKSFYRGAHGHLALRCNSVERALAFMSRLGFTGVEETAKVEKGRLKTIYLDKELGGFAVHLLRD
ncbi:MAG: bifunctional 4-hydroxy-2-oxoglutarate aldolase/2-dehydro-3-deoxy-phosphogluconate aldolase [Spirochaetia bacterium]|nr:bifunctional 4-hydroxy-2-oxoglutarate aldolase/2-dehydro-3-deoxy-phosphogluconate aldolase [Spirochaetia bacterium]